MCEMQRLVAQDPTTKFKTDTGLTNDRKVQNDNYAYGSTTFLDWLQLIRGKSSDNLVSRVFASARRNFGLQGNATDSFKKLRTHVVLGSSLGWFVFYRYLNDYVVVLFTFAVIYAVQSRLVYPLLVWMCSAIPSVLPRVWLTSKMSARSSENLVIVGQMQD